MGARTVVYSGTFDPITHGHVDLVDRARRLFDHITVAISTGLNKKPLFTKKERFKIANEVFKSYDNVEVITFDGLLVDCVKDLGAKAVIRGLRAVTDFEYEFQMASINHKLDDDFETIFMIPDEKYTCLSSTMIREVAKIDPMRVRDFVSPVVFEAILKKFPFTTD
ncbi:MAG: pantetheine-phosphate adenylyltransferase [Francisellaceae bacterium]